MTRISRRTPENQDNKTNPKTTKTSQEQTKPRYGLLRVIRVIRVQVVFRRRIRCDVPDGPERRTESLLQGLRESRCVTTESSYSRRAFSSHTQLSPAHRSSLARTLLSAAT